MLLCITLEVGPVTLRWIEDDCAGKTVGVSVPTPPWLVYPIYGNPITTEFQNSIRRYSEMNDQRLKFFDKIGAVFDHETGSSRREAIAQSEQHRN